MTTQTELTQRAIDLLGAIEAADTNLSDALATERTARQRYQEAADLLEHETGTPSTVLANDVSQLKADLLTAEMHKEQAIGRFNAAKSAADLMAAILYSTVE